MYIDLWVDSLRRTSLVFDMIRREADNLKGRARYAVVAAAMLVGAIGVRAVEDPAESAGCYCVGKVGNVNCDYRDDVTIGDVALLIDHLYISGTRLPNLQEANINGDPEGEITISDVSMLIDHLFISGIELPDCPLPYNTPPETDIIGFIAGVPFINSVEAYSIATGARFGWTGWDYVDHPYDDPEFEYEYRAYGPYHDSLLKIVADSFIVPVFCTDDGRMFRFDQSPPEFFVVWDTVWLPGGVPVISCDTVLIDTIVISNIYGIIDTLFDFEHPEFAGNPDLNRLAVISDDGGDAWIMADSDSLYNLYAAYPSDTTVEMNFVFTVRAREALAPEVIDPTPAFIEFTVIEPKHERDILVMNWSSTSHENKALEDSIGTYWDRAIASWAANNGLDGIVAFDPERDFDNVAYYMTENRMLAIALKYKILINVQDAIVSGMWSVQGLTVDEVMIAMQAGVNVWVAARVPGGSFGSPSSPAGSYYASDAYAYFFGIERYYFPGWGSYIFDYYDGYGYGLPRVEDFVGAGSLFPADWPELTVDTAALQHRYDWAGWIPVIAPYYNDGFPWYPFLPELGALLQVGWCQPTEGAEVLYRYVSLYGEEEHPYEPGRDYHGKPVMHRLDRELFRSVHSLFTPLALEQNTGQQMVDSVLNWLYERWRPEQVSGKPTDDVGVWNGGGAR